MTYHELSVEDWDSLLNLAMGASVLQIGYRDGLDTALLAQVASLVVAVHQDPRQGANGWPSAFDYWSANVWNRDAGSRVFGIRSKSPEATHALGHADFGLAVIDTRALRDQLLGYVITEAQRLARVVAIAQSEHDDARPVADRMSRETGWSLVHSGRLLVMRPPALTLSERDGDQ